VCFNFFTTLIITLIGTPRSIKKNKKQLPISIELNLWQLFFLYETFANSCYTIGGVPSSFATTTSIWIKASLSNADTPTVLLAGTPPGKNVV
jgi:hypothetical protein